MDDRAVPLYLDLVPYILLKLLRFEQSATQIDFLAHFQEQRQAVDMKAIIQRCKDVTHSYFKPFPLQTCITQLAYSSF